MGTSIAEHDLDDDSDFAESHEINVTPFIDVMLVLLIIFMVAAPLSTVDLPIDLPTSTAIPQKKPDKPTYVSIKPDLSIAIGENFVKRVDLVRSLDAMPEVKKDQFIFIRADRARALWRIHGRTRNPARRRLFEAQADRAGGSSGECDPAGGNRQSKTLSCNEQGMSNLEEQKAPLRLWVFGAVGALLLHVGGAALAITHLQTDEAQDSIGETGIEVGYEQAAVHREQTDLPAGPDADASQASPQLAEQKAEVKETDLPQDKPTEPEEADRQVTPTESKKPKEDDPKIAAVQTQASTESIASEATATPASIEKARRERANWQTELFQHLDRHKRYPKERQQKTAEIAVRFTLDRMGRVLSVEIEKSSGDTAFDEAALAMVRRSDPVPVPPPLVADDGLSFTLPVIFRVKTKS